ncbi:MAG: hypothetical protein QM687_07875 [Ferruginibacter sp.]
MKIKFYPQLRVCLAAILLSIVSFSARAQQFLTQIDGWNAYVHLPAEYNDSTAKRYPLICFVAGIGEIGTDPSKMLLYGPSKFVADGNTMEFTVNGKLEKPIIISIQPAAAWPNAYTMNKKLDSIVARYRCDLQRINVTGLSMGGWSWANMVDNYNSVYTNRVTSMVTMSALEPDNTIGNMKYYAQAGGTLWAFEGNQDLRGYDKVRDTMNRAVTSSARYTLYNGGHCCWNDFYTPSYMENGENIYTWMLKQKKILVQAPGPTSPEANAGRDSSTAVVLSTLPLSGNGNDPSGLPISFVWTKVAGPSGGTIANASAMQTSLTGLGQGTYKYELRVTNSLGLVGKDTVTISNGNVVMPVILENFSGQLNKNGSISLYWKTSAEINSSYFLLEKSTDGQSFASIAKINVSGVNGGGAAYNSTDYLPAAGNNFYRLKTVDLDGSFAYSRVINIVAKNKTAQSIAITSAFAGNGNMQLNINSEKARTAVLGIMDGAGKILFSRNVALNKGMNIIVENIEIPRGIYHLVLTAENEKVTRSVIK